MLSWLLCFLTALTTASFGFAAAAEPDYRDFGLVYNGVKHDGAFNESANVGLQRLFAETGVRPRERLANGGDAAEAALRQLAAYGVGNLMAIGYLLEDPVRKVAAEFPRTRFTLIDGEVDLPNVRSVRFREEEAAFLAGMATGLATKSGVVGFVGAVPIPPIRRFECGFLVGVRHVRPETILLRTYLGVDAGAFRDAEGGDRAAREMMVQGADVLFAAAGFSGAAVLRAAAQAGRLGVGVDVNQNGAHPGAVLTSAIKRVDVAVYTSWREAFDGRWYPGMLALGVGEEGVGWARDEHNETLVAPMAAQIEQAEHQLSFGALKLIDPRDNALCRN